MVIWLDLTPNLSLSHLNLNQTQSIRSNLCLAEQDMLAELVEHGLGFKRTKLQPEVATKKDNK